MNWAKRGSPEVPPQGNDADRLDVDVALVERRLEMLLRLREVLLQLRARRDAADDGSNS